MERNRMARRLIALGATVGMLASFPIAGTTSAAGPDFGPNVLSSTPACPRARSRRPSTRSRASRSPTSSGRSATPCCSSPARTDPRANPLNFQVGYYTAVAGLGQSPSDVVINGSVYVRNQCDGGSCTALNNFWRSLSNLTINVTTPDFGCYSGEFWPVSQAAPMRRVHVNGQTTLMDYCTRPVVRERRLHRRLGVRRQHRHQRLAAAVAGRGTARSTAGRTASGTRCSRASPARPPSASPPFRTAAARTRRSRRARSRARRRTSTSTTPGQYQRLRPGRAARLRRHDVGQRPDAGLVDPDRRLLHRRARPTTRTRSTARWPRARTSSSRPASTSSTRRSRSSAPTPSCSVSASRRSCPTGGDVDDDRRRRPGRESRGLLFDAGPDELAGAARGRQQERPQRATSRPTRRRSATCSSASAARPRARPPRASS